MRKKIKIFFLLLLLGFLIFTVFSFGPRAASALGTCLPLPPPLNCFGGPILGIIPPIPFVCWVPQFIIGPPKPDIVAIVPGISIVYRNSALHIGANVLGNTMPPIPFLCSDAETVLKIGTSL